MSEPVTLFRNVAQGEAQQNDISPGKKIVRFARRLWSIRVLMMVLFLLCITLTSVALWTVGFVSGQIGINNLSEQMVSSLEESIGSNVSSFLEQCPRIYSLTFDTFQTVHSSTSLITSNYPYAEHISESSGDAFDFHRLRHIFYSTVLRNGITMMFYGNEIGDFLGVQRVPTEQTIDWSYVHSNNTEKVLRFFDISPENPQSLGKLIAEHSQDEFDPRQREWYINALQGRDGDVRSHSWTKPYVDRSAVPQLAITCSISNQINSPVNSSDNTFGVLGIHLSLEDMGTSLRNMKMKPSYRLVIIEPDGYMIAASDGKVFSEDNNGIERLAIWESDDQIIKDAGQNLLRNQIFENQEFDETMDVRFTDSTRNSRILILHPIRLENEVNSATWVSAIILSRSEMMESINRSTYIFIGIAVTVMLISLVLSLVFSHVVVSPLKLLEKEMHSIALMQFQNHSKDDLEAAEEDSLEAKLSLVRSRILSENSFSDTNRLSSMTTSNKNLAEALAKTEEALLKVTSIDNFSAYSGSARSQSIHTVKSAVVKTKRSNSTNLNLYELQHMRESLIHMKRGLSNFEKYVPAELVRQLMRQNKEVKLGMKSRNLTVMFADIKGFTNLTEEISADKLIALLSTFFSAMSTVIEVHRGTVDKFIGDCIMAFWNAPLDVEDHAFCAVKAAIEMQNLLRELNAEWAMRGFPVLEIRVGINTATCLVGNVGSPSRINYTVLGDGVNVASRLESLNNRFGTGICIGESTYAMIRDQFYLRWLDYVALKGKQKPIDVYEVKGLRDINTDEEISDYCYYGQLAKHALHSKNLAKVEEICSKILERNAEDLAALHLTKRIAKLKPLLGEQHPDAIDEVDLCLKLNKK